MFDNNSIALIEKNFIDTKPFVDPNSIDSFSFRKKQNGEIIGILRTTEGITHIKTISPNGTVETTMIEIPIFFNLQERDMQILTFYKKGYTQVDIATFMGLSQSQVSFIINKYKKTY